MEITHKIQALDGIRSKLEQDLLKLQEDELELDDERKSLSSRSKVSYEIWLSVQGVKERVKFEQESAHASTSIVHNLHLPPSSRRRKGAGIVLFIWTDFNLLERPRFPSF